MCQSNIVLPGKVKDMYDNVYLSKEPSYIKLYYSHKFTCKGKYEYNEMAGLWLNGGVKSAKKLMERGFPTALSWHTLLVFFIVYFLLAALTAGIKRSRWIGHSNDADGGCLWAIDRLIGNGMETKSL